MKNCKIENCQGKYYARGYCRKHYGRLTGLHQRRWLAIKARPEYEEFLNVRKRHWGRTHTRDYKKHSDKVYFGGLREIAIQRDKEECVDCGMTRKEHYDKWNKDLHVNHKDHTKMNSLENFETLCMRCHATRSHYKYE